MSIPVQSVDRALDILLSFSQERPLLSLTEISEISGMPKSTVYRLLATLESKRFLVRNTSTGKYRLGFRFLEMASQVLEGSKENWAIPYLHHLAEEFGETVDLAVLDGDHVIYLQVVESSQKVKIAAAVGQRLPAACTASGKAFLAFLPDEQVRRILSGGLKRYTQNTRLTMEDFQKDMEETRKRGIAFSRQEYENDINAVAAPLLAADGYPIFVIAIAGPSYRFSDQRMLGLGHAIQSMIEKIKREIGLTALMEMVPRESTWK